MSPRTRRGECCSLTFFLLFYPGCGLIFDTSKAPAAANIAMTSTAFPAPLRNSPCEASPSVFFSFAYQAFTKCFSVSNWFSVRGFHCFPQQDGSSQASRTHSKRDIQLNQQKFNGTHISARAGCLQRGTLLKIFPGFLYLYNLFFIPYSPVSSS